MTDAALGLAEASELLLGAGFCVVTALVGVDATGVVAVVSLGPSTSTLGTATTRIAGGELTDDVSGASTVAVVGLAGAAVVRAVVTDLAYSVRTAVRSGGSVAVMLGTVAALLSACAV